MRTYRHAIVVGASSGLGYEIARQLAENGAKVAVVARRNDRLEQLASEFPGRILPYRHDVTNYGQVPALFQEITGSLGGLDIIVYSSGVMPEVRLDEFDFAKDREIFEVNVLGAIAWLNQAAERFQQVGHGTIVGIGSVAGDRGRRGQPGYNASKAALHTYLEALRNRLSGRGVTVVTIKPGPLDTEMTAGLSLKNKMPAAVAAEKALAKAAKPGEHYVVGLHRLIFGVIRNLPSWIFRRLKI